MADQQDGEQGEKVEDDLPSAGLGQGAGLVREPGSPEALQDHARSFVKTIEQIVSEERYMGDLPHPAHFALYKEVEPTAPDRILAMAEAEQEFRHETVRRHSKADVSAHFVGLAVALFAFVFTVGSSVFLALHDKTVVAVSLLGTAVLGVVLGFLKYSKTQATQEDEEPANEPPSMPESSSLQSSDAWDEQPPRAPS